MATNTTKLDLLKPSENDFYNQQTEQAENWEKVDKFADDIQKNVDFNLLATLGIEYGGILNNTDAKVAGKAYYDTTGKKLYKCIVNTSINYADARFFVALSNNDLLGKLQNLPKIQALTVDIDSGILGSITKRERKTFDISALNIKPIYIFPYVPATSTVSGFLCFECVSIVSFDNNNIIVDFDYGGVADAIGIEAKATILYYE